MLIAKIAIDKASPQFDREYDYCIPPGMNLSPGCRVTVPFGAQSRRRQGLVLSLAENPEVDAQRCKPVATQVDEEPILSEEGLLLLHHLRQTTFCSYFDALRVLIPAGLGLAVGEGYSLAPGREFPQEPEALDETQRQILRYLGGKKKPVAGEALLERLGLLPGHPALRSLVERGLVVEEFYDRRRIQDERIVMARLTDRFLREEEEGTSKQKLTQKQKQVITLLTQVGSASIKEICYFCGLTRAVVDRLTQADVVETYEQTVYRSPTEGAPACGETAEESTLNPEQAAAYEALLRQYRGEQGVALLRGVTGSGKTQVYLALCRQVVRDGRQVIVLVPEISLTPQTIQEFRRVFGARTAVLHSSLTLAQRLDEWRRIREGEADVVVGTRSAVFAPLPRLGLVVMDEEQEHTYKSEGSPRFHAREVAKFRCRYHGALLLLCSATPAVESHYQAKAGRYSLVELPTRYAGRELPAVSLVDMNQELGVQTLSTRLLEELRYNLQAGEQSILLLNRRGYSTIVRCSSCGEVVQCPHCSVSLTYHSANGRLLCHYCGHSQEAPSACPGCGSTMVRYSGVGTQRVEEELCALFPEARILRMDMDTTLSRFAYEKKFAAFADGKYDIMVGTQMVAKGLNFPRVTLVGVLGADSSLYSDDFRSFEKTFALLTQVVGRSGRAALPGRAFIQTAFPENPIFALAARQDYEAFYSEEIAFRQLNLYPPYCDFVLVGFSGPREEQVQAAAQRFATAFVALAQGEYADLPMRMMGPSPSGVSKVAGKYRYKILLKCRNSKGLRELLGRVRDGFYADRQNREVTAIIDLYYDGSW